MIKIKKIKNMNVLEIEKKLNNMRYLIAMLIVLWIVISFLSMMYAFTFDPVLALAVSTFFFGLYTLFVTIFYLYEKMYVLLRKNFNQEDKEK